MRVSACCLLLAGLLPAASALHAQTRDDSVTFTTPRTLATNTASWNYTLDQAYPGGDPGSTPAGIFIARGQSSDSDHSITVIGGVTAYEIHTVGLQTADFGFYLMNLDFTSLVPDESITVTWSFKILANDTDDTSWPLLGGLAASRAAGLLLRKRRR